MDHTAYLILKIFGPWEDPCHIISFLPLCWVSVPVCYQQRRDGQTGRRRRAVASVGFTVATETMSSLLNTCFWWHHTPGLSTHSERSSSILSDIKRLTTGVCVCECVVRGEEVSEIIMTKNYWGRNTGMKCIADVNPCRPVGSPAQLVLRQGGLYLFLFTVNAAC